jgi:hypothetical protein
LLETVARGHGTAERDTADVEKAAVEALPVSNLLSGFVTFGLFATVSPGFLGACG